MVLIASILDTSPQTFGLVSLLELKHLTMASASEFKYWKMVRTHTHTLTHVRVSLCVYCIYPFIYLSISLTLPLDVLQPSPPSAVWPLKNMKFLLWLSHWGNISWLSIALLFLSLTSGGDQIPWGRRNRVNGGRDDRMCVSVCLSVCVPTYLYLRESTLGLLLVTESHLNILLY